MKDRSHPTTVYIAMNGCERDKSALSFSVNGTKDGNAVWETTPTKSDHISAVGLVHNEFFTARKVSCGKVVFLHLSVSHSVHRGVSGSGSGGCTLPGHTHTHTLTRTPPPHFSQQAGGTHPTGMFFVVVVVDCYGVITWVHMIEMECGS